ncbi:MAG: hypothetical protein ACLFPW_09970 [Spirochaetaceae bacterium]
MSISKAARSVIFFGDHFEVELASDSLAAPVTVLLKGGAAVRRGEELYVYAPLPW